MNAADALIILCFIAALVRGTELGMIQQVFSTSGFIGGLFAGGFLQRHLIHGATGGQTSDSQAIYSLLIVLGMACVCLFIGELLGGALKMRLRAIDSIWLARADKIGGSLVAGLTFVVFVWLIAGLAATVPDKTIHTQVQRSYIVRHIEATFPGAPKLLTRIGKIISPNGFPKVFVGHEPALDTNTPLPDLGHMQAGVEQARPSVVKVTGKGCGGIVSGSGFVAGPGLVITNAHVIAGVVRPEIIDGSGTHAAQAVLFDPKLDIAVLRVDGLQSKPLTMVAGTPANGTAGSALGFPGGGDFTASPATILDAFTANGRDIYGQEASSRSVYSLKASVQTGNSGGPVINKDGGVIGVIFAKSTTYEQVGYALTMQEVLQSYNQAQASGGQAVGTGSCSE